MKNWKALPGKGGKSRKARPATVKAPRPGRCKAMFAELSDYLDEQLDDSLCGELEKHLDGCEPCKVFLASLEATIQQCRTAPSERPDRKNATELCKKLVTDFRAQNRRNPSANILSESNSH